MTKRLHSLIFWTALTGVNAALSLAWLTRGEPIYWIPCGLSALAGSAYAFTEYRTVKARLDRGQWMAQFTASRDALSRSVGSARNGPSIRCGTGRPDN